MAKKPPEGEKVLYTNRRFRVLRRVLNCAPPRDRPLFSVSYLLQAKPMMSDRVTLELYDYFRNARNRARAASWAVDMFQDKADPKTAPNRPGSRPL